MLIPTEAERSERSGGTCCLSHRERSAGSAVASTFWPLGFLQVLARSQEPEASSSASNPIHFSHAQVREAYLHLRQPAAGRRPASLLRSRGPSRTAEGIQGKAGGARTKGKVRANQSGCLDQCEHGPNLVVYPDAVWYGRVTLDDVDEIIESHIVGGKPVERLTLPDSCLNTDLRAPTTEDIQGLGVATEPEPALRGN